VIKIYKGLLKEILILGLEY